MTSVDQVKFKSQIELIRKLVNQGEPARAARLGKDLLSEISSAKYDNREVLRNVIELRRVLIEALGSSQKDDKLAFEQEDLLIEDLILSRDVLGALAILESRVSSDYSIDKEVYDRCWSALSRITQEFRSEPDYRVVDGVCRAYANKLKFCNQRNDYKELLSQCDALADYLCGKHVNIEFASQYLHEMASWFSDEDLIPQLIEIADTVSKHRSDESGLRFNGLLGECYYSVGEFTKSIDLYLAAVLYELESDRQSDYLLGVAKALVEMGHDNKAIMFAQEVIRRAGRKEGDMRAEEARELIP